MSENQNKVQQGIAVSTYEPAQRKKSTAIEYLKKSVEKNKEGDHK